MESRKEVEFDYFIGREGLLAGVWYTDEPLNDREYFKDQTSQTIYFLFDGSIYRAQENPDDGYRSSLGYFHICTRLMPANVWDPPEPVFVRHVTVRRTDSYPVEEACDMLEFVSKITSKVVMIIGTTNVNDYYPCCTLHFDPTALSHNQNEVDLLGRETAGKF